MSQHKSGLISRRQALISIATIAAGTAFRPVAAFSAPARDKIRFAVIGDWGTGDSETSQIAGLMAQTHRSATLDFVIAAGDNIYPDGAGRRFSKNFEQPFSPLLNDRVSFHAVLGNHDVRDGRQDQIRYPLFNMGGRSYYTLRKGDGLAEFFMLDSTDFDRQQAQWLEEALRASSAKWKIAVFHHPIYSSGRMHGSSQELRRALEPLFVRYKINAVFSGHDHIYERIRPQQGIQYFVTGAGGKVRHHGVDLKSPFRDASYDESNHFMLIEADTRQLTFSAISGQGLIVDSGTIRQA